MVLHLIIIKVNYDKEPDSRYIAFTTKNNPIGISKWEPDVKANTEVRKVLAKGGSTVKEVKVYAQVLEADSSTLIASA